MEMPLAMLPMMSVILMELVHMDTMIFRLLIKMSTCKNSRLVFPLEGAAMNLSQLQSQTVVLSNLTMTIAKIKLIITLSCMECTKLPLLIGTKRVALILIF